MITGTLCFIGGVLFATAYPAPSRVIRDKTLAAIAAVRARIGL